MPDTTPSRDAVREALAVAIVTLQTLARANRVMRVDDGAEHMQKAADTLNRHFAALRSTLDAEPRQPTEAVVGALSRLVDAAHGTEDEGVPEAVAYAREVLAGLDAEPRREPPCLRCSCDPPPPEIQAGVPCVRCGAMPLDGAPRREDAAAWRRCAETIAQDARWRFEHEPGAAWCAWYAGEWAANGQDTLLECFEAAYPRVWERPGGMREPYATILREECEARRANPPRLEDAVQSARLNDLLDHLRETANGDDAFYLEPEDAGLLLAALSRTSAEPRNVFGLTEAEMEGVRQEIREAGHATASAEPVEEPCRACGRRPDEHPTASCGGETQWTPEPVDTDAVVGEPGEPLRLDALWMLRPKIAAALDGYDGPDGHRANAVNAILRLMYQRGTLYALTEAWEEQDNARLRTHPGSTVPETPAAKHVCGAHDYLHALDRGLPPCPACSTVQEVDDAG